MQYPEFELLQRDVSRHQKISKHVSSTMKAFDRVQHVPLFEMLEELDVNGKDVELIRKSQWQRKAAVCMGKI